MSPSESLMRYLTLTTRGRQEDFMPAARKTSPSGPSRRRQDPYAETSHEQLALCLLQPSFTADRPLTCFASQRRPLRDSTTKNAFAKFETALSKKYEQQLADFNEEEYRQLEQLKDLFEFLDDIIPENDDDDEPVPVRRAGRKR